MTNNIRFEIIHVNNNNPLLFVVFYDNLVFESKHKENAMQKKIANCKRLFDTVKEEAGMKTYSEVAKSIGVNRAALSNMMAGRLQISSNVILRVAEKHGMSLVRIRSLMD